MVYFHLFWVDEVGAFLWALRECGDPMVVSGIEKVMRMGKVNVTSQRRRGATMLVSVPRPRWHYIPNAFFRLASGLCLADGFASIGPCILRRS